MRRKEIEDAVAGDSGKDRSGDPDVEEHELARSVSIRASRDPGAFGGNDPQAFDAGLVHPVRDAKRLEMIRNGDALSSERRGGPAISSIVEPPSVSSVWIR
jgi:hypothetical protein